MCSTEGTGSPWGPSVIPALAWILTEWLCFFETRRTMILFHRSLFKEALVAYRPLLGPYSRPTLAPIRFSCLACSAAS